MNKILYQKYFNLKTQIKQLEEAEKSLKEEIIKDLNASNVEKVATDFGSFTICKKVSWKYSDKVKTIADRLKMAQIREQEQGTAIPSESQYLMFREGDEI